MAKAKGVSARTVGRIWKANDIKPHLSRTFKVSKDARFEEKFWDVIGLYLDPPEKGWCYAATRRDLEPKRYVWS